MMLPTTILALTIFALCGIGGILLACSVEKNSMFMGLIGLILFSYGIIVIIFSPNGDELRYKDYQYICDKLAKVRLECKKNFDNEYCVIKLAPLIKDSITRKEGIDEILEKIHKDMDVKH